jgi:MFS family permease
VGVVDILVQGVLVGKLLSIFGDVKLSISSLILVAISYLLLGSIALIASPILLISGVILFAGAGGLVENALRGLTSRMVGPAEQGRVSGAGQSVQSLALILGPLFGGLVYTQLGHFQAYSSGALVIALNASTPNLRNHPCRTPLKPDARLPDAEAHSAISHWKHIAIASVVLAIPSLRKHKAEMETSVSG